MVDIMVRSVVLAYLVATHVLLLATWPCYRYEFGRGLKSLRSKWSNVWDQGLESLELPESGVYASTELLNAIQRNMQLARDNPEVSTYSEHHLSSSSISLKAPSPRTALDNRHGLQSDGVYVSRNLVAYMSATDVFQGQGWKARSAFFVFLLAPRYVLAAARSRFTPELDLLNLASADLPAVVQWDKSPVSTVGYELSCTSPSLSMGLGPQPFANCSVWLVEPSESTEAAQNSMQAARGRKTYLNRAAAAAMRASAAAAKASASAAQQSAEQTSPHSHMNTTTITVGANVHDSFSIDKTGCAADQACSSPESISCGSDAGLTVEQAPVSAALPEPTSECPARSQVASWIILPDNSPESVAQHLEEIGFAPQPYLAGRQHSAEPGLLSSFLDVWLFFPRAKLLQLLPAMSSLQQVLFGFAVVLISYNDLWQLAKSLQQLQNSAVQGGAVLGPLLGIGAWGYLLLGLSVVLQLLMMTLVKAALAAVTAHVSVYVLRLVLWAVLRMGQLMEIRWVRLLAWGVDLTGSLLVRAAYVITFFASVRSQDVFFVVLLVCLSALLSGVVATVLEDVLHWEAPPASGLALCVAAGALTTALYGYFPNYGPSSVLPAQPQGSSSSLWQASSMQSVMGQILLGSAGQGNSTAAVTASMLAGGPWQGVLLVVVDVSQDILMLTFALCVWWELVPAGDVLWKACVDLAREMGVLMECISNCLVLLLAGASVRQALARFWLQMQQRLPGNAPPGLHGAVQAQLVIRAQQEQFADLGQTADALRALADELEDINGRGGMLHQQQQPFLLGGRVIVSGSRRGPQLGTHWPEALTLEFDIDDVRAELGIEVPRGFVCPLTLDIMRQPALLISSNIAVPSSYEKEAISRWLEESRRDPKSRRHLAADAQLVPNFDLYRAIEDWSAHVQALQVQHRQQQKHQQQDTSAALPATQDAPDQPCPPAAATISGGSTHETQRAAAAAAGRSQPSTSSVTLGSLLASARDVVGRGTAAAAARTRLRQHRQHATSEARTTQQRARAAAAEAWELDGEVDLLDAGDDGQGDANQRVGPGDVTDDDGLQDGDAAGEYDERLIASMQQPLVDRPRSVSQSMHAARQLGSHRSTSRGWCQAVPARAATHAEPSHVDSDPEDHLLSDTEDESDDAEGEVRSYSRSSRGMSPAAAAGAAAARGARTAVGVHAQPQQLAPEATAQYHLRHRQQ